VPGSPDPDVRTALIEHAAARLSAGDTVTLRRLAAAADTSTMAIYTHFGGMSGLWREVRQEGFTRLARRLEALASTDNALRDVAAVGAAYLTNALHDPALYGAMFGPVEGLADSAAADTTFAVLVTAIRRARDDGWLDADTEPEQAAVAMWAVGHGYITLALAGALPRAALATHLPVAVIATLRGFGAERDAARRAVGAAWSNVADLANDPSAYAPTPERPGPPTTHPAASPAPHLP